MKVLLCGVIAGDNFGGPSLLHGVEQLIHKIDDKAEIIYYQFTKLRETATRDMNFTIHQIPYLSNTPRILIDAFKYKMGFKPRDKARLRFLEDIRTADVVADLFGICFCDNLDTGKTGLLKAIKRVIGKFSVSFIARMYGTRTVKCPASYGPIESRSSRLQARFAARWIFDVIIAREVESRRQMVDRAGIKKDIPVSPDLANLMSCPATVAEDDKYIGISVSYQIGRQWRAKEPYIDCMVRLINYMVDVLQKKVYLIPNEYPESQQCNDIDVAAEIYRLVDDPANVVVPDVKGMCSTEIKSLIAGSEVLVASRYHSCVAGLSCGVPTLVLGWHYKYEELLRLYGQDRWLISNHDCSSQKLLNLFKEFWEAAPAERETIRSRQRGIHDQLMKIGGIMFQK